MEDLNFDKPKTKQFTDILKGLNISDKKVLFVTPEFTDNTYLSLRNVPTVQGTLLSDLSTYDIINANVLVLTESAAKIFSEEEQAVEA
jgi:large subunit ribosomal protein L4